MKLSQNKTRKFKIKSHVDIKKEFNIFVTMENEKISSALEKGNLSSIEPIDFSTLKLRHKIFCMKYIQSQKAAESYLEVFKVKDINVAAACASRLLKNAKVQKFIQSILDVHFEAALVTPERIISELARIAFFDVRKLYNKDGSLKQIPELDKKTAAAVAGFEVEEIFSGRGEDRVQIGVLKKYKHFNKNQALQLLKEIRFLVKNYDPGINEKPQINVSRIPTDKLRLMNEIINEAMKPPEVEPANFTEINDTEDPAE